MTESEPQTELGDFGSTGATATEWSRGRDTLVKATLYWLSTVRPDGRPHVTPLIGVWHDGAMHFTTGPQERKAKNLAGNTNVVLTTGNNTLVEGLDVVLEGEAVPVQQADLDAVAAVFEEKYGADPTWAGLGDNMRTSEVLVYRVAPITAFGFGKGATYSQTRWRFDAV
jgi:nitroimidazol reductase NimA-like FMN-containing flavoprotein (pyridoxamine 5'-phosphate oxidase superfamily)